MGCGERTVCSERWLTFYHFQKRMTKLSLNPVTFVLIARLDSESLKDHAGWLSQPPSCIRNNVSGMITVPPPSTSSLRKTIKQK